MALDLPKGHELRLKLQQTKVELSAQMDSLKEVDLEKVGETKIKNLFAGVKAQLSNSKILRAQAKAVAREIAAGCHIWQFCANVFYFQVCGVCVDCFFPKANQNE